MIKKLLIFAILACAGVLSAQTYTFECVVNGRLSGDSCDVCPNTIIESRSFNGLVIFRDSAFYKWIDQPYSVRVKPGGIVEYWEHAVNPFSERVTIPFSETGFFSIQGMADSTWCNSVAPHRYQELSLDSLSTTLAKAKLQAGNTGIGLRAGTSVTFDWQNDTLQINVDTTGLGGGGGGSGTVTSVAATAPAAGFSISGSPITTAGTFVFTLANDLAALEGLGSTGIPARTGTETWSLRSITGGTGISIANGDGVSGNPTVTNTAPDQTVVLTNGAGISTSGTYPNFTIASTITQYTDENAQDAVGAALTDSPRIDFTYNDGANTITADLTIASVADAYLQNRGALTVMGRSSNSTGVVADIVSTADGQVLRRSGTTLGWGTVATLGIADQAVTYAKIQNIVNDERLLGRVSGANGVVEELTQAQVQAFIGMSGITNRFALWTAANIIGNDAAFTFDAVNDRATFTGTVTGVGANTGILNLNTGALGAATTFLRMSGNVSSNMIAELVNSNNATVNAHSILTLSTGGSAAGDPTIQFNIAGQVTHAMGADNTDVDKFKITPNSPTVGGNADASFVGTKEAIPKWGINKDAPGYVFDVGGQSRAVQFMVTNVEPTAGAAGSGLGTGGVINDITGGDNAFSVRFTTGTAPTAGGAICTITYSTAWPSFAVPVMSQNDDDSANEITKFTFGSLGGASFELKVRTGQTLTASTEYILNFVVGGQG